MFFLVVEDEKITEPFFQQGEVVEPMIVFKELVLKRISF